jgi:replicative DNA helicase
MNDILDRRPPCDLDAERALIGSIFLKPDVMDLVAEIVKPEAFYDASHRTIYATMTRMVDGGGKIDTTLVVQALKASGEFDLVGGMAAVAKLTQTPNAHHAKYYAGIVRDKAQLRGVINDTVGILNDAYNERTPPSELSGRLQAASDAVEGDTKDNAATPAADAAMKAWVRADAVRMGTEKGGIKTGMRTFDHLTGGIFRGELLILAARPGVGKTALALQIAVAMAKNGETVLFSSLEMSTVELMSRAICAEAGVDGSKIRNGRLSSMDMGQLSEAVESFSEVPLFIDDRSEISSAGVRRAARRIKKEHGLSAVFVDYLTLLDVETADKRDARHEQIGKDSKRLRRIAKELDCAVICMAQIGRKGDEKGEAPKLGHLKDSGHIEQDADAVLFIHRPEVSKPKDFDLRGKASLIIAKNRHGVLTEIEMKFVHGATRFVEAVPEVKEHDFGQF